MSRLTCGFIQPEIIEALKAEGEETRLAAVESIIESLDLITLRPSDLKQLLEFSMQYFLDESEELVLTFCELIDEAITKIDKDILKKFLPNNHLFAIIRLKIFTQRRVSI